MPVPRRHGARFRPTQSGLVARILSLQAVGEIPCAGSDGDFLCFRPRKHRIVAGPYQISAIRDIALVIGNSQVADFLLAQPGGVTGLPAIFAAGNIVLMLRECNRM